MQEDAILYIVLSKVIGLQFFKYCLSFPSLGIPLVFVWLTFDHSKNHN